MLIQRGRQSSSHHQDRQDSGRWSVLPWSELQTNSSGSCSPRQTQQVLVSCQSLLQTGLVGVCSSARRIARLVSLQALQVLQLAQQMRRTGLDLRSLQKWQSGYCRKDHHRRSKQVVRCRLDSAVVQQFRPASLRKVLRRLWMRRQIEA